MKKTVISPSTTKYCLIYFTVKKVKIFYTLVSQWYNSFCRFFRIFTTLVLLYLRLLNINLIYLKLT